MGCQPTRGASTPQGLGSAGPSEGQPAQGPGDSPWGSRPTTPWEGPLAGAAPASAPPMTPTSDRGPGPPGTPTTQHSLHCTRPARKRVKEAPRSWARPGPSRGRTGLAWRHVPVSGAGARRPRASGAFLGEPPAPRPRPGASGGPPPLPPDSAAPSPLPTPAAGVPSPRKKPHGSPKPQGRAPLLLERMRPLPEQPAWGRGVGPSAPNPLADA